MGSILRATEKTIIETTTNDNHEDRSENGNNITINKCTYLKIVTSLASSSIEITIKKLGREGPFQKRYGKLNRVDRNMMMRIT